MALIFERRYFEKRDETRPGLSFFFLAVMVAMGAGELIAVVSLLDKDPPQYGQTVVLFGLTFGVMTILATPYFEHLRNAGTAVPEWLRVSGRLASQIGFFVVIALALIFDATVVLTVTALIVLLAFLVLGIALEDWRELQAWRSRRRGDDEHNDEAEDD